MTSHNLHKVVIVGAGFGGLYAARKLSNKKVQVTVIDKRNFHLFQPLLYQVATGGLSPGDIASPIRAIFKDAPNVRVIKAALEKILPEEKTVIAGGKEVPFDTLVIATGVSHHYFGNDHWEKDAPGLKTVEDALTIRQRILSAFENAELEEDPEKRKAWLRFVIVGGGPTGVELAGALSELAHSTMVRDFRNFSPGDTEIYLAEGTGRVLPPFPEKLSERAKRSLEKLRVKVLTESMVTGIDEDRVYLKNGEREDILQARTILWAAGVKAGPVSDIVYHATKAESDRAGRIKVKDDLTIDGFPDVMVIGDLAHFETPQGPLPGVAPVAMQQGKYAAEKVVAQVSGKATKPFEFWNKGNLAVIGRKAAVADVNGLKFSGWFAWLIWIFVHIAYLIEFDNKIKVLFQWGWNFLTRKRGARLITQIESGWQKVKGHEELQTHA